ncbi:MAG: hypothetical protein HC875_20695 [Anaerolineales bacterium]|nr:hypothetical protein [Anaerolineales bacterium]
MGRPLAGGNGRNLIQFPTGPECICPGRRGRVRPGPNALQTRAKFSKTFRNLVNPFQPDQVLPKLSNLFQMLPSGSKIFFKTTKPKKCAQKIFETFSTCSKTFQMLPSLLKSVPKSVKRLFNLMKLKEWSTFVKSVNETPLTPNPKPKAKISPTPENIASLISKMKEIIASSPDISGDEALTWALSELFQITDGNEVKFWKKQALATLRQDS